MEHLHSLQGVTVISDPLSASVFIGEDSSSQDHTSEDHAPSLNSRIIPLESLQTLCKATMEGSPPKTVTVPTSHTVSLNLSQYTAYDATHSCTECIKRAMQSNHAHTLTSLLPLEGEGPLVLQWHVPEGALRHFVLSLDRRSIERLKLSTLKTKMADTKCPSVTSLTPIITISVGLEAAALLNLSHTGFDGLHIVVTLASQFEAYRKVWPNTIIVGLPDMGCLGTGNTYHLTKTLAQHTYLLNMAAHQESTQRTVWPFVLMKSDQCVMWKMIDSTAKRWVGSLVLTTIGWVVLTIGWVVMTIGWVVMTIGWVVLTIGWVVMTIEWVVMTIEWVVVMTIGWVVMNSMGCHYNRIGCLNNRMGCHDNRMGCHDNRMGFHDNRMGYCHDNRMGFHYVVFFLFTHTQKCRYVSAGGTS